MMMETVLWTSIALIIFAYFGYPLVLVLLPRKMHEMIYKAGSPAAPHPTVSIIISAATESIDEIETKLINTLDLYMPMRPVQIILALDGPSNNLLMGISDRSLSFKCKISILQEKGGKEAAQKNALADATGDIIVFTDVTTILQSDALVHLISHFADHTIGGVDGMSYSEGAKEGLYLKYENKIRELESRVNTLVTHGGCLFAVRKSIIENDFPSDIQSDFTTALTVAKNGFRSVLDTKAIAYVPNVTDPADEQRRKHRTVVRGLTTFFQHLFLLNPFKYGIFSFQLFSHKLLKWVVPFFMLLALFSNIILVMIDSSTLYSLILIAQTCFYGLATIGMLNSGKKQVYFQVSGFFLMANLSILKAWVSYLRGERFVTWKASVRSETI